MNTKNAEKRIEILRGWLSSYAGVWELPARRTCQDGSRLGRPPTGGLDNAGSISDRDI